MKRLFSLFIFVIILPFMVVPFNASAYSVQGTDFPDVSFLPPDIDFEKYPYYFLTVSGSPEKPLYYLYTLRDNGQKHGRVYFSVTEKASTTAFHTSEYTAYGITTDYHDSTNETAVKGIRYFFYSSDGSWTSSGNSDSTIKGWAFDGYSDFSTTSGSKYIFASNVDIYDYSGVLIRKADYSNLCSFFKNNLQGSSEASGGSSSGSGSGDSGNSGLSVDLSAITEYLEAMKNNLLNLIEIMSAVRDFVKDSPSSDSDVYEILTEIKEEINNFRFLVREDFSMFVDPTLTGLMNSLDDKLWKIKDLTEGFRTDFGNAIYGININLKNIADLLGDNDSGIFSFIVEILARLAEIILIDQSISEVKTAINSGFTALDTFLVAFRTSLFAELNGISSAISNIPDSIVSAINNASMSVSSSIDDFKNDIVPILNNLYDLLGCLRDDILSALEIISQSINYYAMSVINAVCGLPDKFEELLKKLFIPQEDHFTDIIEEIDNHFGFVHQIIELGDKLLGEDKKFDNFEPQFIVDLDSDTYGHFSAKIIDFSLLAPHVSTIKSLITGITLYFFIRRWRKRLPDIINGTGGN